VQLEEENEVMQRIKRRHWLNGVMNASMFEAANCSGLGLLSFELVLAWWNDAERVCKGPGQKASVWTSASFFIREPIQSKKSDEIVVSVEARLDAECCSDMILLEEWGFGRVDLIHHSTKWTSLFDQFELNFELTVS
jgi:hypothetical protein